MSIVKGNGFFRQGNLLAAINEYEKIEIGSPLFSQAQFNIQRCQAKEITSRSNKTDKNIENSSYSTTQRHVEEMYRIPEKGTWTAVITVWRRSDYLKEQIAAIINQTIPPDNIIIIQNESHISIDRNQFNNVDVTLIRSDLNSLYTRWIIGYLCNSRYICVFDDDVIPGRRWIELCMRTSEKYNALVGPSGRRAQPGGQPSWKSVETQENGEDSLCDWVCNSYFFQTAWIKYIVAAERYNGSQKTYDDIQLATTLKIFGGINTVVPGQPKKNPELNGHLKREYGHDEHALWKRQPTEHMLSRSKMIDKLNNIEFSWCKKN